MDYSSWMVSNGLQFTAKHVLFRDSDRVRLCAAQFGQFQKIGKIPYNSKKYAEIGIYIRHRFLDTFN